MALKDSLRFTQHTKRFFLGTFLSRCSGLARDLAMAFAFGDHPSVAAFLVAFRFSNLFRRLLGEGPLQSAFIPSFEELRAQDRSYSSYFFKKLTLLMIFLLLVLVIFGEGIIFCLISFFNFSPNNLEIIELTGWMFPGLIFICLYGLNISLLQCYESFFLSSFAPFLCNFFWIAGALYLKGSDVRLAMPILAKFILFGFFAQWLITLPSTLKNVSKEWVKNRREFIPKEVKGLIKSFSFGAIGVGATQINAFLDSIFARYADLKGPVYLWYAIRIEQLALAVLGMACVNVLIPQLSRLIKASDLENAKTLFSFGFRRIILIMIPATLALFCLGIHAVNWLYARESFSQFGIAQTTLCLWSYTASLLPSTLIFLYSAIFYAKGNFRTPTWISLISVAINILLSGFFVFVIHLSAVSTALATSISAWINLVLLRNVLIKEGWISANMWQLSLKVSFCSLFACLWCPLMDYLIFQQNWIDFLFFSINNYPKDLIKQGSYLIGQFILFIFSFIMSAWIFKLHDVISLLKEFFFRKKYTQVNKQV